MLMVLGISQICAVYPKLTQVKSFSGNIKVTYLLIIFLIRGTHFFKCFWKMTILMDFFILDLVFEH